MNLQRLSDFQVFYLFGKKYLTAEEKKQFNSIIFLVTIRPDILETFIMLVANRVGPYYKILKKKP